MTNKVEREVIFNRAATALDALEQGWSNISYLPSLRLQLAYLRAIESGEEIDRSRLADINIGVIAAKDIEDRDAEVAKALHKLAAIARDMATEGQPRR